MVLDWRKRFDRKDWGHGTSHKKIGDAAGVILTSEILERLHLKVGDTVYVTETADGITLTTRNVDLEETLDIGRQVMVDDREFLKKLAE